MTNNIGRVSFDLPFDIVSEILSRTHVKTLIRFKSVCKTWYALIENPNFVKSQQKIQSRVGPTFNAMLVITYGRPAEHSTRYRLLHFSEASQRPNCSELPYLSDLDFRGVAGTCNGLVCVSLHSYFTDFIVCNPITRQLRRIPSSSLLKRMASDLFLGFGLHGNGYMLIRIVFTSSEDTNPVCAEMYTICTNTWREFELKLGKGWNQFQCSSRGNIIQQPTVINGVFYWKYDSYVVSLDIHKENFDAMDVRWVGSDHFGWHTMNMNEHLAMVVYRSFNSIDLWVMDEHMAWTKMHKIDFKAIRSYPANWGGRINVRGCNRGELVLVKDNRNSFKLFLYDLNSQDLKHIRDVDLDKLIIGSAFTYFYTEALTPVN